MLMPVGAISANGQGLLCTGLLLLVCAGLFAAMTAVVYRTTPGRTVCCALPALVSFALLLAMMSGLWDGFDAPEAAWAAPQVGRLPLGAMLAAIMFFWVCRKNFVLEQVNLARKKPLGSWFYPMARYVFCGVTILVLILGATTAGGIG